MRVFITGGTGFIGAHVVRQLLDEGHDIILLTRNSKKLSCSDIPESVTVVKGNLSNIDEWKDEIEKLQPEATIHMAWEGIPNYNYKISLKNLKYGLELITMLAEIGCGRVICTGSCWEYGQKHGKLHENMALQSFNAFSGAKNALYLMGGEIAKENNMHFIWTRLFYVYGPGQRSYSLIPHIINCIHEGKKPKINTPFARNDFIYVEDVATAISMILKNCKKNAVYNIGSGYSTSVRDIVKIVCDIYGFNYSIMSVHPTSESSIDFWADISKIKTDIGWKPKLTISEGIDKTIKKYKTIEEKVGK